jgi:GalNAc-alpha-(1->4)-GalNAc-alpha-(1->3)-diNAcBac-PP-undecaprenol alpha-1,4-N-acetyl-D-galactosaminyltransferase
MSNKILLLVSSMSSGGAERVASTLANAWTGRGDEVTLMPTFSGRGECFYELSPEVRLIYLADLVSSRVRTWVNQLARIRALRRFISTEQPDVIISFLSNVNVAAVIASIGLGIPVIICERTDPFVMPTSLELQLACRLTYPFANVLVVQTQAVATKYATSIRSLKRLWVIPNPVSEQILNTQYHPSATKTKRLLGIGRLDEGKQFDVLIKVFANLVQRHINWSLRIVGDGHLQTVLQQQITSLGLDACIELAGRSTDVGDELVKADIFAMTSKYEGFPNVLLEAMAAGLPCVTFNSPSGPQEISMDGQVALLVPLNDEQALELALERLMLDADLRRTLGDQARKSVIERYSLSTVLEKWDELFAEVGIIN